MGPTRYRLMVASSGRPWMISIWTHTQQQQQGRAKCPSRTHNACQESRHRRLSGHQASVINQASRLVVAHPPVGAVQSVHHAAHAYTPWAPLTLNLFSWNMPSASSLLTTTR